MTARKRSALHAATRAAARSALENCCTAVVVVSDGSGINRVVGTLGCAQCELALCDVMGGGLPILPLYYIPDARYAIVPLGLAGACHCIYDVPAGKCCMLPLQAGQFRELGWRWLMDSSAPVRGRWLAYVPCQFR